LHWISSFRLAADDILLLFGLVNVWVLLVEILR
jgi:hypothetical protein